MEYGVDIAPVAEDAACAAAPIGAGRRVQEKILGRPSRKEKVVFPDYTEGLQIKTEDDDPRFNNALARGLAILRCFDLDTPLLGNIEIAERTGIPKPTISRLTYTLTQLGYLLYRPEFGKYELAAGVMALSYPYVASQQVPALARALMVELAKETKTNIGLGVHEGLSVLYLEYALGEARPNRRQRVGFRVPLVRTAMGLACVAALPPGDKQRVLENIRDYYPREWPELWKRLEEAENQVRIHGYCTTIGTFERTTNVVAVPFVTSETQSIMAFNSQGPAQLQTPARMARTGERLIKLTEQVRALLHQQRSSTGGVRA